MPKLNQGQLLAYELAIPQLVEQAAMVKRIQVAVGQQANLGALMMERSAALDAMTASSLRALFAAA